MLPLEELKHFVSVPTVSTYNYGSPRRRIRLTMNKIPPESCRLYTGRMKYDLRLLLVFTIALSITSCTTSSTTTVSRRQPEERGFFGGLADQLTERECNVGKFICPYGLGAAGEPCTCTDPSGIVVNGRTVK